MDAKTLDAMAESTPEYEAFVEKFKPKKTTDDCYTPENIYDVVAGWVEKEYGVSRENFIRPFYPGGDYEHEDYPAGCVVVDNPPFSILSKIVRFYVDNDIWFFLFAPSITTFSTAKSCASSFSCICLGVGVTYENGAVVNSSFITNLEPSSVCARSCPELFGLIEQANKENERAIRKEMPKYVYPAHIATAAMLNTYSKYGVDFSITKDESVRVSKLDSQIQAGKQIYGGGYLLSERAAAERAAAERAAAEKKNAIVWVLSEREKEIVRNLGKAETAA